MPPFNPILGKFVAVAVGILVFLVALYSARRARPTFNLEGELVMRYSPLLRFAANLLGLGFPAVAAAVLWLAPPKGDQWIPALIFLPCGFILCECIYLEITCHRIIVSGEEIRCVGAFRKSMAYRWSEIVEVTYKSKLVPFVFFGKDLRHFSVSSLMTGMSLLIEVFKAQLDPKRYQRAMKGIEWSNSVIKDRWASGEKH